LAEAFFQILVPLSHTNANTQCFLILPSSTSGRGLLQKRNGRNKGRAEEDGDGTERWTITMFQQLVANTSNEL